MRRTLARNTQGLSVMYDAILFVVLVSLCGVILLPALHSDIAVQTSVDVHREERVDDTLLMLMTARADEHSYTFAGPQLSSILDSLMDLPLMNGTIQALLGRQQLHKTYADLLAENMVSQLTLLGCRVNIFTVEYDCHLKHVISTVLTNQLGEQYAWNLSVHWHPIIGVPFGGTLSIGEPCPPSIDTYVSHAYITLPQNSLSRWLSHGERYVRHTIQSDPLLQNLSLLLQNLSTLNQSIIRENLSRLCTELIDSLFFDGFSITNDNTTYSCLGVVNATIDYVFSHLHDSFQQLFDASLESLNGFFTKLESLHIHLTEAFDNLFISVLTPLLNDTLPGGFIPYDPGGDGLNLSDVLASMKAAVTRWAKTYAHGFLQGYITLCVDALLAAIGTMIDTTQEISASLLTFLSQRLNVLRAELQLTVWGRRP